MDAEGLGRKLLLIPSGDPRRAPEMQTMGTVTASHKMLTLQALSRSLHAGTAKGGCQGRREAFWALWQSVPQNGRVHLHIPEWFGAEFSVKWFGFRPESQSYRPKVGVTGQKSELQPGRPPKSEPNRPEKAPESGFGASAENPLKAFLNPAK